MSEDDSRDLVKTFRSGMAREFIELLHDDPVDGLCRAINRWGVESATAMTVLLAGKTHIDILERERDEMEAA